MRSSTTPSGSETQVETARAGRDLAALAANIERVITGKRRVVELAVVTFAAGGHLLIEDVPGVGKTVLARALARSIDATFSRVQGAPDLLPSDVTGTTVYDQSRHEFRFVPGPLFAHVVLVDELNRTTPRTQAALLEAMEEQQVTVDGTTHALPEPHVVVATQNPIEHHGTFPLPESQLDRFTVATPIGYPTATDEAQVVRAQVRAHPLASLAPVLDLDEVARLRRDVREVTVTDALIAYAVRLTTATREHDEVVVGASPRASVQLVHVCQALATLRGRGHVLPDDVKELAVPTLAHRLVLRTADERRSAIVDELLERVPVDP